MISLNTNRFGTIERPEESVLRFPNGIFGFEPCDRWLLLSDANHGALFWLQSVDQPELSLAVVDPREFTADFTVHVRVGQLKQIGNDRLVVLSQRALYLYSWSWPLRM